jgi:hypothetical protein
MRRTLTAVLLSTFVAGTAFANGGEVPKLERVPHNVAIKSWRGPASFAHLHGMHVQVTQGHPGSKIVVQRQKRSVIAEISGEVSEEQLKSTSETVSQWVNHITFTTKNVSKATPHNETHGDAAIVMRPNSRFRVVAHTRDGQQVDAHGGVVQGNTSMTERRMNLDATAVEDVLLRGNQMKSARAWMVHENLYVTAPETDPSMVREGEGKLKKAKELGELIEKKNFDMEAAKKAATPLTGQPLKDAQAEIATLTTEKQTLEADGNKLVVEGKRSTVQVLSVGGLPVATQIIGSNARLKEENANGAVHTFTANSDPKSGYLHQKLEALPLDEIQLWANFGAASDSKTSYHLVHFAAPTGEDKPAFTMNGKRYYRIAVDPTKTKQVNDDPAF